MIPGGVVLVVLGHELSVGGPGRWRALAVIAGLVAVGLLVAWTLQRWITRTATAEDGRRTGLGAGGARHAG
jgi:hypothetical protein